MVHLNVTSPQVCQRDGSFECLHCDLYKERGSAAYENVILLGICNKKRHFLKEFYFSIIKISFSYSPQNSIFIIIPHNNHPPGNHGTV
jgi:hypothetical protein